MLLHNSDITSMLIAAIDAITSNWLLYYNIYLFCCAVAVTSYSAFPTSAATAVASTAH